MVSLALVNSQIFAFNCCHLESPWGESRTDLGKESDSSIGTRNQYHRI